LLAPAWRFSAARLHCLPHLICLVAAYTAYAHTPTLPSPHLHTACLAFCWDVAAMTHTHTTHTTLLFCRTHYLLYIFAVALFAHAPCSRGFASRLVFPTPGAYRFACHLCLPFCLTTRYTLPRHTCTLYLYLPCLHWHGWRTSHGRDTAALPYRYHHTFLYVCLTFYAFAFCPPTCPLTCLPTTHITFTLHPIPAVTFCSIVLAFLPCYLYAYPTPHFCVLPHKRACLVGFFCSCLVAFLYSAPHHPPPRALPHHDTPATHHALDYLYLHNTPTHNYLCLAGHGFAVFTTGTYARAALWRLFGCSSHYPSPVPRTRRFRCANRGLRRGLDVLRHPHLPPTAALFTLRTRHGLAFAPVPRAVTLPSRAARRLTPAGGRGNAFTANAVAAPLHTAAGTFYIFPRA